ncbi:MAG: energy transducer TonB [Acidobacteriaceae bacterium]
MCRFALLTIALLSAGPAHGFQDAVAAQWPSCPVTAGRVIFSVLSIKVGGEGQVTSADPLEGEPAFLDRAADAAKGASFPSPLEGSTLGLFCSPGPTPRLGYIFHPEAFHAGAPVALSPGSLQANLVSKGEPAYPAMAKARNIQGAVVLEAVIDSEGEVASLFPVSGPPELLHSAIEAVRLWKYKPFSRNGAPVAVEGSVKVLYAVNR